MGLHVRRALAWVPRRCHAVFGGWAYEQRECVRCARRYVAKVGEDLMIKMGDRYSMGSLAPSAEEWGRPAAKGNGYAVWVRLSRGGDA